MKNHSITEPKSFAYKFLPFKEEKKIEKVNLGPASYDAMQSFKVGQGDEKPRFYVSKKEKESFLNIIQRKTRGSPSPG